MQMATLDKAEALLEDLRSASWDAAVKDLDEVKSFAAKQVSCQHCASSENAWCNRQFQAAKNACAGSSMLKLHCKAYRL